MKTREQLLDELDSIRDIMSSVVRDIRHLNDQYNALMKRHDALCEALDEVIL